MNATTTAPAPCRPPRVSASTLLFVMALHLAAVWALSSLGVAQHLVREVAPLMVSLVQAEPPPPAPTAPPPALPRAVTPVAPTAPQFTPPAIVVDTPVRAPEPAVVVALAAAPAPVTPTEPMRAAAVAEPPPAAVAPAPPTPPAPPAPRLLPASAVRYLVPPALEVPMASRRLGEAGTVLLKVVVDVRGLPRQVTLHRSSGFARLDEQAMAAMRAARFQPQTDNGTPIEWVVIAPLQYELD